jgi:cytochrome c-type biogenesis protein CcmH/NrfG
MIELLFVLIAVSLMICISLGLMMKCFMSSNSITQFLGVCVVLCLTSIGLLMSQPRINDVVNWIVLRDTWQQDFVELYQNDRPLPSAKEIATEDYLKLSQHYLQTHPQDIPAWHHVAKIYLSFNKAEYASKIFQWVLRKDPDNIDYRVSYSQSQIAISTPESLTKAVTILSGVINANKNHHMAVMSIAFAYEELGQKEKALFHWRILKSLQEDNKQTVSPIVLSQIKKLSNNTLSTQDDDIKLPRQK